MTKSRLPKPYYLKLRDGGPIKPKRKPYSRKNWKQELTNDGLETETEERGGVRLCEQEVETQTVLFESGRCYSQNKTSYASPSTAT